MTMNKKLRVRVAEQWDNQALPSLKGFVRIPNQSPAFDPEFLTNGIMDHAIAHVSKWVREQDLYECDVEVIRVAEDRAPMLLITVAAFGGVDAEGVEVSAAADPKTVMLYGHLDKQPPLEGWREGLSAHEPVVEGDWLYGRGAADDGYAVYAAVSSLVALEKEGRAHPRCVITLETEEESLSEALIDLLKAASEKIGQPDLLICLDSGASDYERLWLTTSLRGVVSGTLRVRVLNEGIHSGAGSGVVPASMRIMRQLLGRIEDAETGEVLVPECHVDSIPADRIAGAAQLAELLGDDFLQDFAWVDGMQPVTDDVTQLLLNQTWKPTLVVTGQAGMPSLDQASNLVRPETSLQLSIRIPALVDADAAFAAVKKTLEENAPYGAQVTFDNGEAANGWNAPALDAEMDFAITDSAEEAFGMPLGTMGQGGSIPFINLLGGLYPNAQFMVTGISGAEANAHAPNEKMHIPAVKKLTHAIAMVMNLMA